MSSATLEVEAMDPKILTELQRQEAALADLPEGYEFPLFDGRRAIESQRKSGYKNTARAAREIIDNAVEAGAKNVWVTFKRPAEEEREQARAPRRRLLRRIHRRRPRNAPEDGPVRPLLGRRDALRRPDGDRAVRIRPAQLEHQPDPARRGLHAHGGQATLDPGRPRHQLVRPHGLVKVDEPEEADPPPFVVEYMKKNKITLKSGTIVVWDKPDRLTARSASKLREQMLDDFGVVYRYLLDDFKLVVDGVIVQKVDPLFLMEDSRFYKSRKDGGAVSRFDKQLIVKYYKDDETGSQHLELLIVRPRGPGCPAGSQCRRGRHLGEGRGLPLRVRRREHHRRLRTRRERHPEALPKGERRVQAPPDPQEAPGHVVRPRQARDRHPGRLPYPGLGQGQRPRRLARPPVLRASTGASRSGSARSSTRRSASATTSRP